MAKEKPEKNDNKNFIITLLILAGLRIFIFNAAFPVCNNVDEMAHLDLVQKYSKGHVPKNSIEKYDYKTLELLVLYHSPEYLSKTPLSNNDLLPLFKYPNIAKIKEFNDLVSTYRNKINHEAGSFPVYYAFAGLLWSCGRSIGLNEGDLIYFIRFLNIPIFLGFVWISYLIGKTLFPQNNLLQKGLPIMATFFPQDTFYSINSDTLSPLLFSVSFFMLLKILFENKPLRFHFWTGILISLTLLNKASNITALALLGIIVILKLRQIIIEKKFKEIITRLLVLAAISIIPLCLWLIRNHIVLGDITGTEAKADYLGWKIKPLGEMLHHPIFTLNGLSYFLSELIKKFWRGEFVWFLKPLSSEGFDWFYVISTAVFIIASLTAILKNKDIRENTVLRISFFLVAISVIMLACLSIMYDFGKCWYPSRALPYFTSGRLILTILVPFLILYLKGLERLSAILRIRVNPLAFVIMIVIAITISEFILNAKVFSSPYNWFHLG